MTAEAPTTPRRLRELAWLFAKLGFTAFGGPAAHVAMMEHEVVHRRSWLTRDQFLDLLGATNLIPGPNSTEMAIHIGHARARWLGLIVAGTCFILPAFAIVLAIAWAYVRFHSLPVITDVLYGIKPVIIAIVIQALWRLGRTAIKTWLLAAVGALAFAASLAGVNELLVLAGAGALVAIARSTRARASASALALPTLGLGTGATASAASATAFGLWPLFLVFLKIGAVLFGGGYVLVALLRNDLVDHLHWLDEARLLDAVAIGQVTPGPLFTTATFIGYLLAGATGAVVATVAIFLPAFIFVALSGPLIPRLRRSSIASSILDGVNVASLALMAVVTLQLGRVALIDLPTIVLAAASAALLLRFRLNTAWLVLAGGLVGALVR